MTTHGARASRSLNTEVKRSAETVFVAVSGVCWKTKTLVVAGP